MPLNTKTKKQLIKIIQNSHYTQQMWIPNDFKLLPTFTKKYLIEIINEINEYYSK